MSHKNSSLPTFLHWFSWTISVASSAFFLVFMIGEGIPDMLAGKDKGLKYILSFLLLAIVGCLLSFFKRKAGASMMLAGGAMLVVVLYLQGGMSNFGMMVVYGLPFIFPGSIFLLTKK